MAEPLIIKNWELGVADSPEQGIGLIRNADIESFPGALRIAKKPRTLFHSITTRTFTAVAATDVCTASAALEANSEDFRGAAVYFTTTGTLPAGLSTGTVYFLIFVSATTFKVASTLGNTGAIASGESAIDITDAGTGTHTINQLAIGTIKHWAEDPRTNHLYMMDSNGRVWLDYNYTGFPAYLIKNGAIENVTGALTNASGNGLAVNAFSSTTATYLFAFRNNVIDVVNLFADAQIENPSWTNPNGWNFGGVTADTSMNTAAGVSNSHKAIKAQDNIIYFCDDRYVGTIKEKSGQVFDPANTATYEGNDQALDLPSREIAQTIEEHGSNLLIGGNNTNKIYPWDRTSDSFNLPLICPERSIKELINVGGTVFIFPGTWGNIYTTQGTYVKFFKKVPTYLTNNSVAVQSNPITWGGVASVGNSIIFGMAVQTSGNSGIYRLYLDGRLIQDNTPSTGSKNVTAIFAKDEFYRMGYQGGADEFESSLYTGFEGVVHSELAQVATKLRATAYSRMECVLAKPATSGNVRVGYRQNTSGSFTTLATYAADGSTTIFTTEELSLIDLDQIQIQIEFDGPVEIEEIRLLP